MTTSISAPIWLLIIIMTATLFTLYLAHEKGRKKGRKETTWLQKMSIELMQDLSGYPRPHLTVIPITDNNGLNGGNRNEYPECPESFSLCVLLDDVPAEPKSAEEAMEANLKIQTQKEYLFRACYDFEQLKKVGIKSKEFDRIEIEKNKNGDIKILNKIIFLKVDTQR